VLGTDSIDFRARRSSAEEAQFLAAHVAGTPVHATYDALEAAPVVVVAALEPEDESPILFLRLRKAARNGARIVHLGPVLTNGVRKVDATWIPVAPGAEAAALTSLDDETRALLSQSGSVLLVGERIADSAGAASAAAALAQSTGSALAWVPRRAGERGALDAGALAGLLPGGRPLTDTAARAQVAAAWGVEASDLPAANGLSGDDLLTAASRGELAALVVAGVELGDFADPALARAAVEGAGFVVSLENHHSEVTQAADVVLPVAVVTEKSGTFLNWEGRPRPFAQVFRDALTMADARVLSMIAHEMGASLPGDVPTLRRELGALGPWTGARWDAPQEQASTAPDGIRLATWRSLLDSGVMQEGEPHLAATARPVALVVSETMAAALGETATITGSTGSLTLPVVAADVAPDTVWATLNSPGCHVYSDLGVAAGGHVTITAGGAA
jgi:NADH-quinone oxidoreductase subunit G